MEILKQISLLIVEDEKLLREALREFLTPVCGKLLLAGNGRKALEVFAQESPDLILTDIVMPEMDGIALTEELHRLSPETPVIFYSALSDVPHLLRGIELGVAGFIPKPCDDAKLLTTLRKAALPIVQKKQLVGLESELQQSLEQFLGRGPTLRKIATQVTRIARSDYAILIQGETGTGKSRLATMLHNLSPRAGKPFITAQIGALPETLVAADLFGHERGAFTGAERKREGLVSAASGGTLFLDDIDSAPLAVQSLLLQLVENKIYHQLGSNRIKDANIRIIAASNKNLPELCAGGLFRQDLFYRLATFQIDMPPLRTTPEDIPDLVDKFVRESCQEMARPTLTVTSNAMAKLKNHAWPGNIRELRNTIKRATVIAEEQIDVPLLDSIFDKPAFQNQASPSPPANLPDDLPFTMDAVERWALERALAVSNNKKMVAARLLGMNYYTFRRALDRHGISVLDT